jgi:hypothetical protein
MNPYEYSRDSSAQNENLSGFGEQLFKRLKCSSGFGEWLVKRFKCLEWKLMWIWWVTIQEIHSNTRNGNWCGFGEWLGLGRIFSNVQMSSPFSVTSIKTES